MKIDYELIDKLLYWVESQDNLGPHVIEADAFGPSKMLAEYTFDKVIHHVRMCVEAGYIRKGVGHRQHKPGATYTYVSIEDLTWAGHEYIRRQRLAHERSLNPLRGVPK